MVSINKKDKYYWLAKKDGYVARSIYKLHDIDITMSLYLIYILMFLSNLK